MTSPLPNPHSPQVRVTIPMPLRREVENRKELQVQADTLRELLLQLEQGHPKLHRCICDETGAVRRHINLFVEQEHMRELDGLDTRLQPQQTITIMTAVSGG